MIDDAQLLRRYVESHSEPAFAAFVERHLNLVYFAALRRVNGNAALAKDVAQYVFTTAAREAASLMNHATVVGWLHTTTRNIAAKTLRAEQTRQRHEQDHDLMREFIVEPAVDWDRLRPVIDESLGALKAPEREVVLLRFFEGRAFSEIGAILKISEDAARMRAERALGKLHGLLKRRGVTSTAAALAVGLVTQAGTAAPAGLAASVTSTALAGAAMATTGSGVLIAAKIFGFMSSTKIIAGVAGLVLAAAATTITLRQQQTNEALRAEIGKLRQQSEAIAALRVENQRLLAEKTNEQDARAAEHTELVRLKTEKDAFIKAIAARKAAAAHASESTAGRGPTGEGKLAPGMISMEAMANVGRATPSAAGQTLAWALQQADFKTAAEGLTFEAPEREKLEAFIATLPEKSRTAYGTPEQLVALLMAGSPKPIVGVQVLSRTQAGADAEIARVQWQYQSGELHQDEIKFRRESDGWKQVVSPALTDRVIAYLKAKQ